MSVLPDAWKYETDVLVAGGGVAGLTAAVMACQQKVHVIVLEASARIGGTALLSGGWVHTHNSITWDDYTSKVPTIDPVLGKLLADTWPKASKWVKSLGIPLTARNYLVDGVRTPAVVDFKMGPDPENTNYENKLAYCEGLANLIRERRGTILTKTKVTKLWQDTNGQIIGVRARATNKLLEVKAKAIILATGGFQSNKEMIKKYMGGWADLAVCRSSPYNTGAGIMMALDVGAMMSRSMGKCYGHTQVYPLNVPQTQEEFDIADLNRAHRLMTSLQELDHFGIYVNLNGDRFSDEAYLYTNVLNESIMQQPFARAFLIVDQEGIDKNASTARNYALPLIKESGVRIIVADTIGELTQMASDCFNITRSHLARTVNQYNETVMKGVEACAELEVPRTGYFNSITKPPFYCIPVTAGISMTYGGVAINERCQVLDRTTEPIKGLYAVPGTAGGIQYHGYIGSLSSLTTFGYLAGKSAADFSMAG